MTKGRPRKTAAPKVEEPAQTEAELEQPEQTEPGLAGRHEHADAPQVGRRPAHIHDQSSP